MVLLAYGGVIFAGITAVLFVDYFILRRQRVVVAHLFASPGQGLYWFRGGANWIGLLVIVVASAVYLALFDPFTLRVSGIFRWFGASIPALVLAGGLYYGLMKAFVVRRGASEGSITVGL
jgi:cytosine/uracil/thiamine/allantoin permease